MRTFDETQKGKKLKRDQTLQTQLVPGKTSGKQNTDLKNSTDDQVKEARERLKRRFTGTGKKDKTPIEVESSESDAAEESKKETKSGRVWHTISDKVDKKSLDKFDLSTSKDQTVNLQAEMEKYLGGDDEVL